MINMVWTNVGRNMLRDWLSGGGYSANYPIAMAMGSGTGAAVVTDTQLGGEIGSTSNAGSIYRISPFSTITLANQEVQYEAIFPSVVGSQTTFGEIGIFDNATSDSGSMFARATFTATTKTINEEWTILYYIKMG